jgi:hypothetical protein
MSDLDLQCPEEPSATGAYQLSWDAPPGAGVVLSEEGDEIYRGDDASLALSGRREGVYAYELEVVGGQEETSSCAVEVAPPSLGTAALLFSTGALVFGATVALITVGHRKSQA